jgi:hypothetical protein
MFQTLQPRELSSHTTFDTHGRSRSKLRMAVLVTSLATSSMAFAEEQADAAVTAAARALAIEGVKLAQSDRCGEAIDKLERAEQLHHAPIVLARLGECYVKQGRLVEGIERLRSVVREPLPQKPSEALQQAYSTSKSLLEATRPKLATLTISIDAAPNAEPTVTIDDKPVPAALFGAGRPTDPGDHLVKASASRYLTTTRRISIGPGEEQTVMLALVMDRTAPRTQAGRMPADVGSSSIAASTAADAPLTAADHAGDVSPLLPAFVAWGAGAVALGVGIGFGVAALNDQRQLHDVCPNKTCPANQRGVLDTARVNATISTVGYATAIAGAAIGTVLYFMVGRSEAQTHDATKATHATTRKAGTLAAGAGLSGAELSLTF